MLRRKKNAQVLSMTNFHACNSIVLAYFVCPLIIGSVVHGLIRKPTSILLCTQADTVKNISYACLEFGQRDEGNYAITFYYSRSIGVSVGQLVAHCCSKMQRTSRDVDQHRITET